MVDENEKMVREKKIKAVKDAMASFNKDISTSRDELEKVKIKIKAKKF